MNSDPTQQQHYKKSSSGLTRKQQPHHHHHHPQAADSAATTTTTASSATARSAEHHHRQQQQQQQHHSHGGTEAAGAEKTAASHQAPHPNPNDVQQLKAELDREKQHRHQAQCDYADLKRRLDEYSASFAAARQQPVSKYDQQIAKQTYFNETLAQQIAESKEKLKEMSHSLKHIQACGKECDIHTRDLIVDYHCISKEQHPDRHHQHHHHHHPPHAIAHPHPHHHHHHRRRRRSLDSLCDRNKAEHDQRPTAKDDTSDAAKCLVVSRGRDIDPCEEAVDENGGELSKEIRRFQRMQIDLKSNLDRLQWRLDCESKIYHSVNDQYQKLQMDLYYLKNLNEKGAGNREMWMG